MLAIPTTYAVSGCNDTNVVIGGPAEAISTSDYPGFWKEAVVVYGLFETLRRDAQVQVLLPLEFLPAVSIAWRLAW